MIHIVGSGPTGIAAARALLSLGYRVTMLDAGVVLENEISQRIERMAAQEPNAWGSADLESIKRRPSPSEGRVPLKYVFGSDFAYRDSLRELEIESEGIAVFPSLARGGLANVWGGAILPYADDDMSAWPISRRDLEPHYREVAELIGIAAAHDDLEERFPLFAEAIASPLSNRQLTGLLHRMQEHREHLRARGISFGQSRVAVRSLPCRRCGLCLYGCPYQLIYNPKLTLEELRHHPGFSYHSDIIVERLDEVESQVLISARHRMSREPLRFTTARVLLAAGVIPSTRIILASRGMYHRPVEIKDSQYFVAPLLDSRRAKGIAREPLSTLSELFVELLDPEISPHYVHLQLYGYSEHLRAALREKLGSRCFSILRPIAHRALESLLLIQGYLHSRHSGTLEITLKRQCDSDRLELKGIPNPESRAIIARALRRLGSVSRQLGARPLTSLVEITPPGRGYHLGGSFPMSRGNAERGSDCLGRPLGFRRVHLVDSSTFPSIPATTITFTAMANAHRIAVEVGRLE